MTKDEFRELYRGDLVRHEETKTLWMVTEKFGDRVTVVQTKDLTNPIEWRVEWKARYTRLYYDNATNH